MLPIIGSSNTALLPPPAADSGSDSATNRYYGAPSPTAARPNHGTEPRDNSQKYVGTHPAPIALRQSPPRAAIAATVPPSCAESAAAHRAAPRAAAAAPHARRPSCCTAPAPPHSHVPSAHPASASVPPPAGVTHSTATSAAISASPGAPATAPQPPAAPPPPAAVAQSRAPAPAAPPPGPQDFPNTILAAVHARTHCAASPAPCEKNSRSRQMPPATALDTRDCSLPAADAPLHPPPAASASHNAANPAALSLAVPPAPPHSPTPPSQKSPYAPAAPTPPPPAASPKRPGRAFFTACVSELAVR